MRALGAVLSCIRGFVRRNGVGGEGFSTQQGTGVRETEVASGYTGAMEPERDFVAVLRRWEDAGGVWRVLGQDRDAMTVGLYRCDNGEDADRFVATDPRVIEFVAG